jgi:hypothetical protein
MEEKSVARQSPSIADSEEGTANVTRRPHVEAGVSARLASPIARDEIV